MNWVLTAGHCYNKNIAGRTVSVWAGVHPNKTFQKFNIKSGDIHVYDVTQDTGDIMLIKLPGSVSGITPAQLPGSSCQTPSNGEKLQLAGHGSTVDPNGHPERNRRLQCLDLKVRDCNFWNETVVSNYFCGGLHKKAFTCPGDSGGGWLKKRFRRTGVIYGVLSGRFHYQNGSCTTNSRFTSVCAPLIRKWINDTMTNHM
ncbi:trypsin-4-like isoform X1 [Electrophorus electricus]|uniref:trypsin-4-like isoform X1 n=1 Tax=Electrophorus electricus TaxID=8005 RepID=UPI0015D0B0F0|nr:trypsin-4-like isoform X1 [Electrophorus electricus]XP_035377511.1 trypsin-4-like isoform X1 [Electrophorus electricus]XP_035377512.1 trypsin-4-like isoform X1 [Electrophorus electricus]